jgi:WD40 repeat protein
MASFERNTDIVMLFSFHFETNELPRQVATIRLHTSFVEHTIVCMEYIPTKNQLITSSVLSMGYLSFWDISNLNSPTLVHRMEMATPLELVIWMPTLHACICTAIIFPALQQTILHTPTTGTSKRHSSKTEGGGSYHPHDLSTSSQAKLSELVLVDIQHFTYHALMDHELLKGVSAMISIGKSLCNRLHIAVGRSDGVLCLVDMEKSTNDTISSHDDDVDHSHIVRPSTSTNIGTATLVDAHGSGVRALAYSHEFQYLASIGNFVVTDATTLHIIIWKAKTNSQHHSYGQHYHNYSNAQSVLKLHMTIDGHHAPLDTIIFVDAEKQFISSDTSGMFRIYSTLARNFRLLQIFQVQPNPLGASLPGTATCSYPKFLVVPENNAKNTDAILVVYTSNPNHLPGHQHAIEFYERSEIRSREEILFAHYCISLNFILCISSSRLLLWNAETGALLKVHYYKNMYMSKSEGKGRRCLTTVQKGGGDDGDGTSDFGSGAGGQDTLNTTILGDTRAEEPSEIKPRNITAACVDDRGRKAILGDDLGAIRVVNIVNGNVMKKLDPHQHAINYLSYMRYARRVISCCVDGTIHICDENNIVGYYVPFRGLSQSVLIQSIRFLPSKTPTFTGITGENTPLSQRSPSRMGNCEKKNGNDSSQLASSKTNDKFDVCKAVANAQLNLIAVLFNGNNAAQNVNESFIQVWNLEFNHAQGTCIAPDRSEITCLEFFGSIGSILGGTSIGGVYLWTPVKNRPLYW